MIQINTNHPHWGQLSRLFTQNQKCQTHGGTIGHFLPWESWMSEQNFMTIHLIVETFQSSFTTQTSVLPIPPIFFFVSILIESITFCLYSLSAFATTFWVILHLPSQIFTSKLHFRAALIYRVENCTLFCACFPGFGMQAAFDIFGILTAI